MQVVNPDVLFPGGTPLPGAAAMIPGIVLFLAASTATTLALDALKPRRKPKPVEAGRRRTLFGHFIHFISGNPVMPVVTIALVFALVGGAFWAYGRYNSGTQFFADVEPERATVYVRARGNLSLEEKDALVREVEQVVLSVPGVQNAFSFAGAGAIRQNTVGAQGPRDQIGQVQIEFTPFEARPKLETPTKLLGLIPFTRSAADSRYAGDKVVDEIERRLAALPGVRYEALEISMGPAASKPVHLRLKNDDRAALAAATEMVHAHFDATPGLTDVEDTRPLPGIDWQLDVDVEAAGRYGTNVATVGGMVQLVTNGLLLDTMRIEGSDQEIEIRVRLPERDRVLSTLDTLKLRTPQGLVPLSNFVSRKPVPTLAQIDRVDRTRYFDVKAAVDGGLVRLAKGPDEPGAVLPAAEADKLIAEAGPGTYTKTPVTANERIGALTDWLASDPLPAGVSWSWTGDQEEQQDSTAFLSKAFSGALFLMFIILLAQFNSIYNATLVLLAVVLSTAGVLVGMLVMGQQFSIIMTGTGIVALAGIVVNNNIVLIDTFHALREQGLDPREAATRTAAQRLRPVLLTTVTTIIGLLPMVFQIDIDFGAATVGIGNETSDWWVLLSSAIVFGLAFATLLTLVLTPVMLAAPYTLSEHINSLRGRNNHEPPFEENTEPTAPPTIANAAE